MTPYSIDPNVPIPARTLYPLRTMKVGDSFWVPCGVELQRRMQTSIGSRAYKMKPMIFTIRMLTENGKHGLRVWRTA